MSDPNAPQMPSENTPPPPMPQQPTPQAAPLPPLPTESSEQSLPPVPPAPGQAYPTPPAPGQAYPTPPAPGQAYPTPPAPGQAYPTPPQPVQTGGAGKSLIVLLLGIGGFLIGLIPSVIALFMAKGAREEYHQSSGAVGNLTYIKIGVILSWIVIALSAIGFMLGIAFVILGVLAGAGSSYSY